MCILENKPSHNSLIAFESTSRQNLSDCCYRVISEKYTHVDLGKYTTFGIEATGTEYSEMLHDVSVCKATVDRMVQLFNQHKLSPVHLRDAIEDMLSLCE